MPKYLIPLTAALLLMSACCPHNKACGNRYCPPTAPTRPICPQAKPACKQASPRCGCKKKTAPHPRRQAITLSNLMDYLPGQAPGYLSI